MEDWEHPEDSLHLLFMQIVRLYFAHNFAGMDKVGLHPGQAPLLFELHRQEALSQKELSERLMVRPSTVTVMISRMEKNGMVERYPDETDQRVSRVRLTDKGREAFVDMAHQAHQIERDCFRHFSREERLLMKRFFLQMKDNLTAVCAAEHEEAAHD